MRKIQLFRVYATVLCLLTIGALAPSRAQAQTWNKKTTVTFKVPVEVPGVGAQTLPAGTYVFKLANTVAGRNIVQIFNADETHVFTTILAINNYRLESTDETVMRFQERAEGRPEAIRAWFYPGDKYGQEFVYPKVRAMQLAKAVNEPVLATPIELATAPVEALQTAPVIAVKPTGEEVELAQVVQPLPPTMPTMAAAKSLPKTASFLPIVMLAGMLSLGAAFTVRLVLRHTA